MRLVEALKILDWWSRKGRTIFTHRELRKLFQKDKDSAFKAGIDRLITAGFLIRVARGVYWYKFSSVRDPYLLERIAATLRRGHYNYLSLEWVLSAYGIISQVPLAGLTIMTTGRSGLFYTPFGGIEFTHTKRSVEDILANSKEVDQPLRWATPATAIRDLRRIGRNLHLVDDDELVEVIENTQ